MGINQSFQPPPRSLNSAAVGCAVTIAGGTAFAAPTLAESSDTTAVILSTFAAMGIVVWPILATGSVFVPSVIASIVAAQNIGIIPILGEGGLTTLVVLVMEEVALKLPPPLPRLYTQAVINHAHCQTFHFQI